MSLIDGIYWQNVYEADNQKARVMTWSEKIRSKITTDEGLADFILWCREGCEIPNENCVSTECRDCIVAWLKQEAKDG